MNIDNEWILKKIFFINHEITKHRNFRERQK